MMRSGIMMLIKRIISSVESSYKNACKITLLNNNRYTADYNNPSNEFIIILQAVSMNKYMPTKTLSHSDKQCP